MTQEEAAEMQNQVQMKMMAMDIVIKSNVKCETIEDFMSRSSTIFNWLNTKPVTSQILTRV